MARPPVIENSPHRDEIVDCLKAGWSAHEVRSYLVERHGESAVIPSRRSIQRYRDEHIDPVANMPARLIRGTLKKLRGRVDEIHYLDSALRAQRERIDLLFAREQQFGQAQPQLNEAMRVFGELLRLRFQFAQQIGIGRAGQGKRVELTESRTMDLPEEAFQDFMDLLRSKRDPV